MQTPKRYLVTSALPYANGPLHVGHLTGAYIPADIYVRYLRMKGADVKFICGSDEHGAAITIRAKQAGMTPREIIDKYHAINKKSFADFGISFDIYHRTSEELHHETSKAFFKKLHEQGVFSVKKSMQYYDEKKAFFLADRYIKGECPKCAYKEAYGDQCESCGSDLSPTDLINPISTLSNETPILKETQHWYLPMQNYQDWVTQWIEEQHGKEKWKKHVIGQCRSWLNEGLQERAMTRDLDWGVKVPLEEAEGKVLYVWLDAPIGYISATKALTDNWQSYWQDRDAKLVHFIGKDNIVFHCIIFPILLKAHGDFILPQNIPANQFMNLESSKVSTSRNHAVWIHEYLEDFPDMQDILRYALIVNMPENRDSDFTWQDFKDRNDKDLVDGLGNFINRTLILIYKHFEGKISKNYGIKNIPKSFEKNLSILQSFRHDLNTQIHAYEFRKATNTVMSLADTGNKLLSETEPWKLIKTDRDKAEEVLGLCLDIVITLAVYLKPFLPFTSDKIRTYLNLTDADIDKVLKNDYSINLPSLDKPEHFFKRIDEQKIQTQIDKLNSKPKKATHKPVKKEVPYSAFEQLDIRTATIINAKPIKNSKKLLQLEVDLGFEQRTIVAGIGEQYNINDIKNQKVVIVANLAPKKIKGVESQGMILMTVDNDSLQFLASESNNGCEVR